MRLSMKVVLTYNAKPPSRPALRQERPQFMIDEEEEPPPVAGAGSDEDVWAEWDDEVTILAVADALAQRHEVKLVEATPRFPARIQKAAPDLVFNIAEGSFGVSREAQVPAVLEMLGYPYTGSDPLTLAVCLDKAWTKMVLAAHSIPTARFALVDSADQLGKTRELRLPALVKPLFEGSSKGIKDDQLVKDAAALADRVERVLAQYRQPALVEEFLPGREFTVAIMGNGPDLKILPPVELKFDVFPAGVNPIYSWEAKWVWDRPENPLQVFECPAKLSEQEHSDIVAIARDTVEALRIRDWARIDLRMDTSGRPNIIEVNPLPGILPDPKMNSCYPKAARAAGMDYTTMILGVVEAATRRLGRGT
jgi:D-alanine-D-alanine ligase